MLYKVVLTFKSVDETLVCDHSDESYWAALSCGIVYHAVQGDSNFKSCLKHKLRTKKSKTQNKIRKRKKRSSSYQSSKIQNV